MYFSDYNLTKITSFEEAITSFIHTIFSQKIVGLVGFNVQAGKNKSMNLALMYINVYIIKCNLYPTKHTCNLLSHSKPNFYARSV